MHLSATQKKAATEQLNKWLSAFFAFLLVFLSLPVGVSYADEGAQESPQTASITWRLPSEEPVTWSDGTTDDILAEIAIGEKLGEIVPAEPVSSDESIFFSGWLVEKNRAVEQGEPYTHDQMKELVVHEDAVFVAAFEHAEVGEAQAEIQPDPQAEPQIELQPAPVEAAEPAAAEPVAADPEASEQQETEELTVEQPEPEASSDPVTPLKSAAVASRSLSFAQAPSESVMSTLSAGTVPTLAAGADWYQGTADIASFTTVNIVNSYTPTGSERESWDASKAQDGSVMAYVSADGTTVTIAGNGSGYIMANSDSSFVFDGFSSVKAINGTELLNTSNVTRMDCMFSDCTALESLNLDNWDVSNVYMFNIFARDCSSLTSFGPNNLRDWDTSSAEWFSSAFSGCESLEALDVSGWDMSSVGVCNYMFADCKSLEVLDVSAWDLSSATKMAYTFQNCTSLATLDFDDWNTPKIIDMSGFISGCAFTTIDVSGLDLATCENIDHFFYNCKSLETIEGINTWNTEKVELTLWVFYNCESLQSLDLSNWKTPAMTGASSMFSGCKNLKVLDISGMDTSNASMSNVFKNCLRLQQVTLGADFTFNGKDDTRSFDLPTPDPAYIPGATGKWQAVATGSATDPKGAVYLPANVPNNVAETYVVETLKTPVLAKNTTWYKGTTAKSAIVTINLVDSYAPTGTEKESWDASAAQDGSVMAYIAADGITLTIAGNGYGRVFANQDSFEAFRDFTALTSFNNASLLDTSKAVDLSYMFRGCEKLATLDVSTWDTSSCTEMQYMFYWCKALTVLDVSDFDTSKVTKMQHMFGACPAAELDVSGWDTSACTDMSGMFYGTDVTSLDVSGFDTSKVTDMSFMFAYMYSVEYLDVSGFDTSKVTDLSYMFSGCGSETLDVSGFDTSKNRDFSGMFQWCTSVKELDVSGFKLTGSTKISLERMFLDCDELTELDLSNWDTSNVVNLDGTFTFCESLTELDLSNFDTSKVTTFVECFRCCKGLEVLNISSWDTSAVTDSANMNLMFKEMPMLQQVTLGSGFSFNGATDTRGCNLPTPDPAYIPGVTGKWQAVATGTVDDPKGPVYLPANVPNNVAETYVVELQKIPILAAGNTWYKGTTGKSAIVTINVVDSYAPTGTEKESWDASAAQDGSVMAYVGADGTTLTIAGNGSGCVYANPNSTRAFGDANWSFTDKNEFSSLKAFNGGDVLDMSRVENATWMFYNARLLESIDVSTWDVSNITVMDSMFGNCYAVQEIDVADWDVSNVTDFTDAFLGCKAVTSLEVEDWQIDSALTLEGIFCGCSALASLDLSSWDTAGVQDMNNMFSGCQDLTSIGDISGWDTSSCTDMHQMFQNCDTLESVDVSEFDTSSVADMHAMFFSCLELTTIDVSSWNTAKVEDMGSMFSMCWNLETLDVSGFDTANVTDMGSMFANCSDLEVIDVSGFDTSKVEDMGSMFSQCRSVKNLDVSGFDTAACTDMSYMFYYCHALKSLDLSSFDTSAATDMGRMLTDMQMLQEITLGGEFSFAGSGSTRLTSLPTPNPHYIPRVTGNWQAVATGTVEDPTGTVYAPDVVPNNFAETYVVEILGVPTLAAANTWYSGSTAKSAITVINIVDSYTPTGFEKESWDASAESDGSVMAYVGADGTTLTIAGNGYGSILANADSSNAFQGFTKAAVISGLDILDVGGATSMTRMFYQCNLVTELDVSGWDVSKARYLDGLFGFCKALTSFGADQLANWDVSSAWDMSDMFYSCDALERIDVGEWDVSSVWDMGETFAGCDHLTSLDVSEWDTSSLSYAVGTFADCETLPMLDVSAWDTSKVTSFMRMFSGCESLTVLDVSNFETGSCTNFGSMFMACRNVKALDMSGFDTSKATTLYAMFMECDSITSLDVSSFNTAKVTDFSYFVRGCNKLADLTMGDFNTSSATNMSYMFEHCPLLTQLDLPFETSKVTKFQGMFNGCTSLKKLDIGSFDTTAAANMSDMFAGMVRLQQVTLGAKFSFTGAGSTSCALPTPDPAYIPGAIGMWQAVGTGTVSAPAGALYLPENVPSNVAETYVMPQAELSVDVPVKVVLAAEADGTWCTPTASGNQIANRSLLPVQVVSAKATAASGFTMVAADALAGSDVSNVFGGTIKAGAGVAQDLTAIDTSGSDWTMAAQTAADDSDLISLQLAGGVANVEGKYFTSPQQLFTITYTFELVF